MDQAAVRTEGEQAVTARTRQAGALAPDPAIIDPAEHNVVFTSLVTGDDDIVGLVAYSIYKQNKYDWLQAYGRLEGRMPEPAEVQSYLLGESTPRRLATYRHLAQAVLDGRGPQAVLDGRGPQAVLDGRGAQATGPSGGMAPVRAGSLRPPARQAARVGLTAGRSSFQLSARAIVGLTIALLVLLVVFWVLHSGAPLPPQTPGR